MPDKFPEDYIRKYDKRYLLDDIKSIPKHLSIGYDFAKEIEFEDRFSQVVLCGVGGSSIASFMLQGILRDSSTPIIVNRGYKLPKIVTRDTLVVAVSYSGNTEETISAFRDALRKKCALVVISVGGRFQDLCRTYKIPLVKLRPNMAPRASIGYQLGALLHIAEKAKIIKGVSAEIKKTQKALKSDLFTKPALEISEKLVGKVPLIYSSEPFYSVAYRWKSQFNENSKIMAFSDFFSELNHNEILGYLNSKKQAKFHIIMLRTPDDAPRMQKRMNITRDLAQERGIDVTELDIKGNSHLTRMMSALLIGDLTSYYLALRYEVEPEPFDDIETLKKKLGPFV